MGEGVGGGGGGGDALPMVGQMKQEVFFLSYGNKDHPPPLL